MSRKGRYQKYNNSNIDDQHSNDLNYRRGNWRDQRSRSQNNKHEFSDDNRSNIHDRLGNRQNPTRSRSNNRSIRNPRSNPRYQQSSNNDEQDQEDFYKITIPHGNKYEEEYICRLLHENLDDMDDPTIFYNFHKTQSQASFFVIGSDKADALRSLSRRIQTDRGQRLIILTSRSGPPNLFLNDQYMNMVKEALSSRYDIQTHILNLSKFRQCEIFKRNGIFIMLSRTNVLKNVLQTILQNAPNTIAIDLSENSITTLEPFGTIFNENNTLYQLKALDLSKNKIKNIEELQHLKNLNLIELVLEGNPFVNKFDSPAAYVSGIRKICKNLKTLDKEELPDQIGFDLGVQEKLPEAKGSFIPDEVLKSFISGFLQEYYRMYDSENRQQLMVAYHDNAIFSLSVSQSNLMYKPNDIIMKESHNLLRVRDESQWVKRVKTTNVDIISFLNKLPLTKHQLDSFQVDIPFFSKDFINVVINGLFRETYKTNSPLRSFCRTFFLAPHNNGFVIVNEMFLITNPSFKQSNQNMDNQPTVSKREIKDYNDIQESDIVAEVSTSSSLLTSNFTSPPIQSPTIHINQQREEIIQKFKEATKMNRSFSIQCLEENDFNPQKAYAVFIKIQQANALPPEAFIGD